MQRIAVAEREDWRQTAEAHGFAFHSIDDDPYWDESAYYRFTLEQIESDLEDPAEEIEGMCFDVVERALGDEEILRKLGIPEYFWDYIAGTWRGQQRNLYGRLDFSYAGEGPAKLLEYNADTPTTLYESSIFQWIWLEQAMERGLVPQGCDQFNSLHEKLIDALGQIGITGVLHLACAHDSEEDKGTVEYLEDCARQAGLDTSFIFMRDIGLDTRGRFTDLNDEVITTLFKLYPWEWLMSEEFGDAVPDCGVKFIEPAWKSVLSNKGLMALLWEMFEGHPNLLPSYFEDDPKAGEVGTSFVRKPLLSREGLNISLTQDGAQTFDRPGPYGSEGHIVQAYHQLAEFDGNYPMLGCWLIASQPAGLGVREDRNAFTSDDSRFIPHVILD